MLSPSKRQMLLEKYRLGHCSKDELAELDSWFDSIGKNSEPVFTGDYQRQQTREDIYSRLMHSIDGDKPNQVKSFWTSYLWRAAAVVFIVASLGIGVWYKEMRNASQPEEKVVYNEIRTSAGEQKRLILPDGSVVVLNSAGSIRFPYAFAESRREVQLEGQAFFQVTANKHKPFLVKTGRVCTRVLGTSFDIKAYQNDERIDITVTSGKVQVMAGRQSVNLLPNQKASYNVISEKLLQTELSSQITKPGWLTGELVFEGADMKEIIETLNRTYNVQIECLYPQLAKCHIDARFNNESIDQIMSILCNYLDASYEKSGKHYKIKGGNCQ